MFIGDDESSVNGQGFLDLRQVDNLRLELLTTLWDNGTVNWRK